MNVVILSAIRSGSTYLTHMLQDTNLFSYPAPYSDHPSLISQSAIREFMAPNPHLDPWKIADIPKTKEACMEHLRHKASFKGNHPVLLKILMEQYQYYMLGDHDRPFFEELFPNSRYIWLERDDVLARTVSAYIFFHSKVDHIYTQKSYDQYMSRQIDIDEKGLLDVYKNHVKRCRWDRFLEGSNYHKISYDDLVKEPVKALDGCLNFLGIYGMNSQAIVDKQPKFKTERPENQEWIKKLRNLLKKVL